MPTLHELQGDFARCILLGDAGGIEDHVIGDGIPPAARLGIYRNTARTVLTEALRLAFPVVHRLVGGDFFDMAAARFIRRFPPRCACLDDYGGDFPAFLGSLPEAMELQYLPDVARFEWALNVASHAPEVPPPDLLALADLDPGLQGLLRFEPHPSVVLLRLEVPADEIADAILSGDERAMAAVDIQGGPVAIVVHRGPDGVAAERVGSETYEFLERLFAREDLGTLLSGNTPEAAEILARQFALGRITGFTTDGFSGETEVIQ